MEKKLSVIQINDTHGYIAPHEELYYDADDIYVKIAGGFARIKTVIDTIKKDQTTFIFDNGDTFHGTAEIVEDKGKNLIPLVNHLGIDAMTFHWDVAYTPKHLKEIGEELTYPILAINAYEEDTDELYFDPYTIIEKDGLKLGVIGIAANIIDKTMPANFSEGLYFTMGEEELPAYIEEVKAQDVDLVIVLSHIGFPQDVKMMERVDGVDICLSSHTHNRLAAPVQINETILIQSGSQGSFIGQLDLIVEDKKIKNFKHQLLDIHDELEEEAEMKKLVDAIVKPNEERYAEVVGETDGILHRGLNMESTMDNFLLEALVHQTKTDLAFSNGWRYGAPIDTGEITLRQLYQINPMNSVISTVELTGQEVYDMLEENLENTYAADPYKQIGGYVKRSLGLKVFFKIENPKGERIHQIFVGDAPIDREKTYSASYITIQGVPKKYGKNHQDLDLHVIEAMQKYLTDVKIHHAQLYGTFEAI